eukprot:665699-Rhodomonas_salina.1
MRPDRGAPIDLIKAAKDLKEQGDYVFMQCDRETVRCSERSGAGQDRWRFEPRRLVYEGSRL